MKPFHKPAMLLVAGILSWNGFAAAPVEDLSDNFAMMDDNQAVDMRPGIADATETTQEEKALAQDDQHLPAQDSAGLLDKIRGLQQEIQELRGQLEVQAHDLKLLQQQQLSFYKDLDARLRAAPKGAGSAENASPEVSSLAPEPFNVASAAKTAPVVGQGPAVAPTGILSEQQSYLQAYELVKNRRFDEALSAMQSFVARYPEGDYTANAEYWLGELYLVKNDWPDAMHHFGIVLQRFPASSKASASLLKTGYALAASGQPVQARERFEQVISRFPDTPAAQLARDRLDTLKATG